MLLQGTSEVPCLMKYKGCYEPLLPRPSTFLTAELHPMNYSKWTELDAHGQISYRVKATAPMRETRASSARLLRPATTPLHPVTILSLQKSTDLKVKALAHSEPSEKVPDPQPMLCWVALVHAS